MIKGWLALYLFFTSKLFIMKKIKNFFFTALITAVIPAIVYTSCKKDACKGVVCNNGGTCNGGKCSCPTGFSGNNCELSTIIFRNDAYTPVSITVNGSTSTIDTGGSVSVTGTAGSITKVTAFTSGKSATGANTGSVITWSLIDTFPKTGTPFTQPLDMSADDGPDYSYVYFYLQVINKDSLPVTRISIVSFGDTSNLSVFESVNIPNDGHTYGIGYFMCYGPLFIEPSSISMVNSVNMGNFSFNPVPYSSNTLVTITVN
jgi:hypothetical protein